MTSTCSPRSHRPAARASIRPSSTHVASGSVQLNASCSRSPADAQVSITHWTCRPSSNKEGEGVRMCSKGGGVFGRWKGWPAAAQDNRGAKGHKQLLEDVACASFVIIPSLRILAGARCNAHRCQRQLYAPIAQASNANVPLRKSCQSPEWLTLSPSTAPQSPGPCAHQCEEANDCLIVLLQAGVWVCWHCCTTWLRTSILRRGI